MQYFIAKLILHWILCCLVLASFLVSHSVFSIYYPKSIQGRGRTLGFWCNNFFPDTFMHWVTLFKGKPPIQWGLVSMYMLMEKCCAIWPEVSSVPLRRNPSFCSAFCPSPTLLSLFPSCRQLSREVMIKRRVLAVSELRLEVLWQLWFYINRGDSPWAEAWGLWLSFTESVHNLDIHCNTSLMSLLPCQRQPLPLCCCSSCH